MGLDAPLLQLLAPCTDSRTSPRRFSHDDYSVITKAASPTILTCTRRDATYKAGPSQFYRILPFSPHSTVERARLRSPSSVLPSLIIQPWFSAMPSASSLPPSSFLHVRPYPRSNRQWKSLSAAKSSCERPVGPHATKSSRSIVHGKGFSTPR